MTVTLSVPVNWKKITPSVIPKRRILQGLKITSKSVTAADEAHLQSTWKSTLCTPGCLWQRVRVQLLCT